MKKIILLVIVITGFISTSVAQTEQTIIVPSKGIYQEIDVSYQNKAIKILKADDKELIKQTVKEIFKSPHNYIPPVFYALSRVLFQEGKKDEASYWFYLAQLRARYDANLCMDKSAKQAVSVLNMEYGPEINKHAFKDIETLKNIVENVVIYVRKNDEDYDHRWINLHGMDAMIGSLEGAKDVVVSEKKQMSQPKEKWAEIKEKTIDDYYNGFMEFVKSKK